MPSVQPNMGEGISPLIGRWDLDPGRWRPMWYGLEVELGINQNDWVEGSVTLNAQPFTLIRIQSKIIGDSGSNEFAPYYQDGMYDVMFRDEQSNYQNRPIPVDLMWGGASVYFIIDLPFPIPFAGNKTITFRVINRINRAPAGQRETVTVGFALHGVSDWGTLSVGK